MSLAMLDRNPTLVQPTPPPPPATIEETGLHPDTLAQILLKTLVSGEASGTSLSEKMRVPYSVLDLLIQHGRVEKLLEVRGASGAGSAGYRYALTDLGRDRANQFFDLSRYVGPAPVPLGQYNAYVRACMAAKPYLNKRPPRHRFRRPGRQQGHVRRARPGGELGQVALPLRRPGQRQDRAGGGHRPRLRRRDVHAVRDRRGWPDHHDVRPGQPQADWRYDGERRQRGRQRLDRPPLGEDHPPGGRGRRRADARDARPDLQPDRALLRGADPDEGQRRRVRRRRLRPPAHSGARPAEPVDRPAREPRRLPDAAHRPQVRDPVQRAHRLCDQPEARVARRRSVPAPDPLQDPGPEPDDGRVPAGSSS